MLQTQEVWLKDGYRFDELGLQVMTMRPHNKRSHRYSKALSIIIALQGLPCCPLANASLQRYSMTASPCLFNPCCRNYVCLKLWVVSVLQFRSEHKLSHPQQGAYIQSDLVPG